MKTGHQAGVVSDSDSPPLRHSPQSAAVDQPFIPLPDALSPILPLFHAFLTDSDAVRLLHTSHSGALVLLPSYTFTSHIFQPPTLSSLRRLRDLCLTYSLCITQLGLPKNVKELTLDPTPPHLSPIPATVTALTLCPPMRSYTGGLEGHWAAMSAAASDWQDREPWRLPYPS